MGQTAASTTPLSAAGHRFALVVSRFNEEITGALERSAVACLREHGAAAEDIRTVWVPGAVEIPLLAQKIAETGEVDGIVTLGAVIRGDTPHFQYVAQMVADGVMCVMLEAGLPVIFGVLTTDDEAQARARIAGGSVGDKGREAALTAIEMVAMLASMA